MSAESKQPVKIGEFEVSCPNCNNAMLVSEFKHSIPHYGEVLISVAECSKCGFRRRDVEVLQAGDPRKITYVVEEPGDENAILIRSSACKLEIPELGLAVEPGAYSQGFITTVEGLILDFIEALDYLCSERDAPPEKCKEVRAILEKAKDGRVKYSVVIYDYFGTCGILGRKKAAYEPLT
ncbi:MAG: ZPR1 zinc finger domain-containing protein [Desulfurococcaceae archaeon]